MTENYKTTLPISFFSSSNQDHELQNSRSTNKIYGQETLLLLILALISIVALVFLLNGSNPQINDNFDSTEIVTDF